MTRLRSSTTLDSLHSLKGLEMWMDVVSPQVELLKVTQGITLSSVAHLSGFYVL